MYLRHDNITSSLPIISTLFKSTTVAQPFPKPIPNAALNNNTQISHSHTRNQPIQYPCVAHCKHLLTSPTTAQVPQTLLPHCLHAKAPSSIPPMSMSISIPSSVSSCASQSSHRGPDSMDCDAVVWYENIGLWTGVTVIVQKECRVDFCGFVTVRGGASWMDGIGVCGWRCARKSF
jgi:hypothetical protein